ncbi:aspartyl/asparaginyl beta-hydroxylase domain-containing protein [Sphingomonas sp. S1-29]|uniref:aspartyl/asparaginyl beta-hydroxylase domain-containing protein n=1 Tax=Sphingomonas sp. S1-29 TaxID=2991074 RepID=UPI00223F4051|nr:aspartyl/asparaginyl beta-hydroxylase domain-containing protein [Sphingomonas sp. S1-29]UZK68106.1 aspartyl/asparaginyl beta-hydroxylase domain-containing protein [Sphingomonas sp. S1-29]
MAMFRQVLDRAALHPIANNALGMFALDTDQLDIAERHFIAATQGDPSAPELWMNVATARRRKGDPGGERDALHRVLDLDQRHIGGIVRLAELHERRGEYALATFRWSALLQLAQGIADPAPQFAAVLDHARSYVEANAQRFADLVEGGLTDIRATAGRRELRRFDACVDKMLGRRRIYANECHGLHFPFLPADEFFDREHFDWLPAIEAAFDDIRREALSLLDQGAEGIVPYVSMGAGAPTTKWTPLDRSLDWSVFYLWRFGRRDDDACRRCPDTARALEKLPMADMPRRAPTAFFSILKPRTRLPAHSGVSNARAIVHLPLIVPEGCGFRVGGETRQWREGEAFVFDDTIEHEAWNDSDQPRVVLIFDVWNPYITTQERALLRRYFEVADASGFDPGMLGAVHD